MHIFNVWPTIMQSLNIMEWKLFELQIKLFELPITQTWHPLRISDGKMSKLNTCKN